MLFFFKKDDLKKKKVLAFPSPDFFIALFRLLYKSRGPLATYQQLALGSASSNQDAAAQIRGGVESLTHLSKPAAAEIDVLAD